MAYQLVLQSRQSPLLTSINVTVSPHPPFPHNSLVTPAFIKISLPLEPMKATVLAESYGILFYSF